MSRLITESDAVYPTYLSLHATMQSHCTFRLFVFPVSKGFHIPSLPIQILSACTCVTYQLTLLILISCSDRPILFSTSLAAEAVVRSKHKGTFKKYVARFLTKFDPLPSLCHKLSYMAKPPIRNVTGHNTPSNYMHLTEFNTVITKLAKGYSSTHRRHN